MKNMFKMLKDAASLQKNVKKIQSGLRQQTVEFSSGGGKITVTARGDGSIANIKIDPSVINPGKATELEKMVLGAVEGAIGEAKKLSGEEMKKFAAEMGLPNIPGL
ncbi:YbaB/EbfC family nucleoid-associated protein [Verrucomicrobiota bacterium]